jgi:hypothetical protein
MYSSFVLNFPWTLLALVFVLISVSTKVRIQNGVCVISVKFFWWAVGYLKGMRSMAMGSVILLGPHLLQGDLEHEFVHIEQYRREPFVHPFCYWYELFKNGYRNNKYEVEAYEKAGNLYKG